MSVTTTPIDCSPNPDPAEPRMIIWTTLRCLELQIDQHEERYNSDGVVSWELIKHMVRLAKRHAYDVVNVSTADVKRLREYEQAIAQMKSALESARSEANVQAVRLVAAQRGKDQLQVENHSLAIMLQCLRRFASAVQGAKQKYQFLHCQGANEEIEAALKQLQASDAVAAATVAGVKVAWSGDNVQPDPPTLDSDGRNYGPSPLGKAEAVRSEVAQLRKALDRANRPQPPTDSPPAVTEPVDDSSGADGPGQS